MSYKQALFIGIAQIAALIPGTSRAGASIIGAMIVGFNRKASAEFSFYLLFLLCVLQLFMMFINTTRKYFKMEIL